MKRITSAILVCIFVLLLGVSAVADDNSQIRISFLDVGEGDAALITCEGYTLMIDGGPSDKSDYIYTFLKKNKIERIDYMVATHADADHIGGLSGALNYATVGTVMCPVKDNDTKQFESFVKYLDKQKNHIVIPKAGDRFSLGTADVEIIYPERGDASGDNTSIALKIEYGEVSFLFMGDNEVEDENRLIDSGLDISATVLKIGHHGSISSTGDKLIDSVNPKYAVISVGSDNTYGHPSDIITEKLIDKNISVFRTDTNGLIECVSDGKVVEFSVEKELSIKKEFSPFITDGESPTDGKEASKQVKEEKEISSNSDVSNFVANTNTKKFHIPSCNSVKKMSEKNKWYFSGSRDELIQSGYVPCKICNP